MKRGAVGGRKYGDADMDPAPCPTDDKDRSAVGDADDTNAAPCLADGTANRSDAEAAPCPADVDDDAPCLADGTANRSDADDKDGSAVVDAGTGPCSADAVGRAACCAAANRGRVVGGSTHGSVDEDDVVGAQQMIGRRTAAPRVAPTMRGKYRREPPIAP